MLRRVDAVVPALVRGLNALDEFELLVHVLKFLHLSLFAHIDEDVNLLLLRPPVKAFFLRDFQIELGVWL